MVVEWVLFSVFFFQHAQTAWRSAGIALKIAPFESACNSESEYMSKIFSNSEFIYFFAIGIFFSKFRKCVRKVIIQLWTNFDTSGKIRRRPSQKNQSLARISGAKWSWRLFFSHFDVLLVPTYWPKMSAKLPRSSEIQHSVDFAAGDKFWSPSPSTLYSL